MAELSDEAKAEIAAAIEIVRQDRMEKYLRDWHEKRASTPPPTPPTPPVPPTKDAPTPPPTKVDPPTPTPPEPPTPEGQYSRYWGEILR